MNMQIYLISNHRTQCLLLHCKVHSQCLRSGGFKLPHHTCVSRILDHDWLQTSCDVINPAGVKLRFKVSSEKQRRRTTWQSRRRTTCLSGGDFNELKCLMFWSKTVPLNQININQQKFIKCSEITGCENDILLMKRLSTNEADSCDYCVLIFYFIAHNPSDGREHVLFIFDSNQLHCMKTSSSVLCHKLFHPVKLKQVSLKFMCLHWY